MSRLVDSHTHFWNPTLRHHSWLEGNTLLDRAYAPIDIEAGKQMPDGLVFVEADCRPGEALDEAKWASGFALAHPPVVGIVAHAPVERPQALRAHLEALAELPLVVGVRRLLQDEPIEAFENPDLIGGLRVLGNDGYTFDACVRHGQLHSLALLARSCPDTSIVLDHVGKPPISTGHAENWRQDLKALAACPNVSCKLSGLATESGTVWSSHEVQPYLTYAIDVFGPDRCMFGSDWPVALLATTYEQWLEAVGEATNGLSAAHQADIFAGNAIRIYGLQLRTEHERTEHAGG